MSLCRGSRLALLATEVYPSLMSHGSLTERDSLWEGDQNHRMAQQILGRTKPTSDRSRHPDASGVWRYVTSHTTRSGTRDSFDKEGFRKP